MGEFDRFHGLAKIVTLTFGAAVLQKRFELLRRFHTLGDDTHIQTLAHADDETDDNGIAGV
jgi:hypothetical protein